MKTRCLLCGRLRTTTGLDPRLPLLRLDACERCRDLVAYDVGWAPNRANGHRWERGREQVYVC